MTDTFNNAGDVMQYTVGGDTDSGDVVLMASTLGVALMDIASGKTGPVRVNGVFRVPKVTADVLTAGDPVVWVIASGKFGKSATVLANGDITGGSARVYESAGSSDTTALIAFTGVPGDITTGVGE